MSDTEEIFPFEFETGSTEAAFDPRQFLSQPFPGRHAGITNKEIRQNIQHSPKFHEMINTIQILIEEFGGYIFGGFVRDQYAGIQFNDIDARFKNSTLILDLIERLKDYFCLDGQTPKLYFGGCYTVCCRHQRNPSICIKLDLTYDIPTMIPHFDFDVNMLCYHFENGERYLALLNDQCSLSDIQHNIDNRQFIILDSNGSPNFQHCVNDQIVIRQFNDSADSDNSDSNSGDSHDFVTQQQQRQSKFVRIANSDGETSNCISRTSYQGIKLLERIEKMKNRGWTCINETCANPDCICADQECLEEYQQKLQRRQLDEDRAFEKGRTHQIGWSDTKRITGKNANTIDHEKNEKSRSIDQMKIVKRQKKLTKLSVKKNGRPIIPKTRPNGFGKIGTKSNPLDI